MTPIESGLTNGGIKLHNIPMPNSHDLVIDLSLLDKNDADLVGEKFARLADMLNASLPVPPGFVVTTSAYLLFIKDSRLDIKIKHLLGTVNFEDAHSVGQVAGHIRKLIKETPIPEKISKDVFKEYEKIGVKVNISSPDIVSDHSYIAQGESVLLDKIRDVWADSFAAKDLFSRNLNDLDIVKSDLTVLVQVDVGLKTFGTLITTDPKTEEKAKIITKHKLSDTEKEKMAKLAQSVEKHFYFPQEVKWVIEKGRVYILSSQPVAVPELMLEVKSTVDIQASSSSGPIILAHPVNSGIGIGEVLKINTEKDFGKMRDGMVLVLKNFEKKFLPRFKKAKAVIIENGDRNEARELGIPTVTGASFAYSHLKDGMTVTVNGKSGEVHQGNLNVSLSSPVIKTATKLYVSAGNFESDKRILDQVNGLGILSVEEFFKEKNIHPKKIIEQGKKDDLVNSLADFIAEYAKYAYPRPVLYKISDLVTNEYGKLNGGKQFEEIERDPMLGYHGVLRHLHDKKVFEIELEAIKKVRERLGFTNVRLLLSFVRSVKEAETMIQLINASGLRQSHTLKIFMSIDLPSNVIQVQDFIDVGLDGVWVNTDSLTNLTLGIDPENPEVKHSFDPQNKSLLWSYSRVFAAARNSNVCAGAYGKTLSEDSDLATEMVMNGVEILAVKASSIEKTKKAIQTAEKKIIGKLLNG